MIDLPLPPKLWVPQTPAIIRAGEVPKPCDFRKGVFAPGFRRPHLPTGPTLAVRGTPQTSTSDTVSKPTGVVAGDLIVILQAALTTNADPSTATPSGFTQLTLDTLTASANHYKIQACYRLADGSEGSSFTGMDGANADYKICIAFSGGIATATPNTWGHQATASAPTSQTISATSGSAPLIAIAGLFSVVTTLGSGTGALTGYSWTGGTATTVDVTVTNVALRLAYSIQQSSLTNVTVGMGDGGNNALVSGYIACA